MLIQFVQQVVRTSPAALDVRIGKGTSTRSATPAVDFDISCHLFQQSMSYQQWGVGTEPPKVGVSAYPRRLMSASAGSFENAFSTKMLARSRSETFGAGAFPAEQRRLQCRVHRPRGAGDAALKKLSEQTGAPVQHTAGFGPIRVKKPAGRRPKKTKS
jgi:hypothetical protein